MWSLVQQLVLFISSYASSMGKPQKTAPTKAGIVLRPSAERGHSTQTGLDTYFSFSFAGYLDDRYEKWGALRVLNEDKLVGDKGFAPHAHDNFEIFSYVMEGELHHKDSMGNEEIVRRGGIQYTSAGKGITHSEYNANVHQPVRLLQVWIIPEKQNLKPSYRTKHFSDEEKTNKLLLILSKDGRDGSIQIRQQADVYACVLSAEASVEFQLDQGRLGYIHLAFPTGKLSINDGEVTMNAGDGAYLTGPIKISIKNTAKKPAEFLLFDLPPFSALSPSRRGWFELRPAPDISRVLWQDIRLLECCGASGG